MTNEKRIVDYREMKKLFGEKYRKIKKLIEEGETHLDSLAEGFTEADHLIRDLPAVDAVPVVRCNDCKWFVPKHILMDDGSTREYTEEEKKLPLGVPGNVGINCGSRCMRQISWLENSVPVWVQKNDFCSYGERKEATP